jgi:predicted ArsR family transcriptional regulator
VRKHDRIVEMLTTEPMTMESIAAKIHLSLVATYRRVKRLREEGRVVIAKWVRDVKDGRPTAMYRAKSGKWSKDARKPDGLTVKERKVRARKAEQDVSSVRLRAAETLKEVKVLVRSKKPGQWWE